MCENIDQSKLKLCKVWEICNLTGPTLRMNEKIDQNLGKDRNEKKKFDGLHHLPMVPKPYLLAEFVVDEVPNIDVNARNIKEWNLCIWTCCKGHVIIVKLLLQYSNQFIELNATNKFGWTVFMCLCFSECVNGQFW